MQRLRWSYPIKKLLKLQDILKMGPNLVNVNFKFYIHMYYITGKPT